MICKKIVPVEKIQISRKSQYIKKILIIKPSSLGDVIHTFPVAVLLNKSLPGVKIDWVINKNLSQILDYMSEYINRIIPFNRNGFKGKRIFTESISLINDLRRERYDAVIDLQGLLRSSLMTFITRANKKVGFSKPKEKISRFSYNKKIIIPSELTHAIEKNLYLVAEFLEIDFQIPDFQIPLISKYCDVAKKILNNNNIELSKDKYIIINPGARWKSKRWPPSFFAEIADLIVSKSGENLKIVIIGGKEEENLGNKIINKCKIVKPVSIIGKTGMIELVEVIRNSELIITNDSGPMHIAAALGKKVFALFGPTDPELTGPFWENSRVFQNQTGCIKCFKRECYREFQECQTKIHPSEIIDDIISELE